VASKLYLWIRVELLLFGCNQVSPRSYEKWRTVPGTVVPLMHRITVRTTRFIGTKIKNVQTKQVLILIVDVI
jgi:hypothetical protein